jgi:hypothetical protein
MLNKGSKSVFEMRFSLQCFKLVYCCSGFDSAVRQMVPCSRASVVYRGVNMQLLTAAHK